MTTSGWNDPADEERNPHRAEERRRTRDEFETRLRERRIELMGDESDEDVMLIVNAVETFEGRLAQLGEDSFVNTPESSQPDDDRLVLPAERRRVRIELRRTDRRRGGATTLAPSC